MAQAPKIKIQFNGFDEFQLYLAAMHGELGRISERAMKKATLMAMTEITDRIRGGRYKKLSPLTAFLKNLEGYSSTPLIRRGALLRSITREVVTPYKGVVGVNKNATWRKKGGGTVDLGSIALGLHEGMRIRITEKMRIAFIRKMGALRAKAGGASMLSRRGSKKNIIRIPPRPFIKEVFDDPAFIVKVEDIFWAEMTKGLGISR